VPSSLSATALTSEPATCQREPGLPPPSAPSRHRVRRIPGRARPIPGRARPIPGRAQPIPGRAQPIPRRARSLASCSVNRALSGAGPDDSGAGPDDSGAGPDDSGPAPDDTGASLGGIARGEVRYRRAVNRPTPRGVAEAGDSAPLAAGSPYPRTQALPAGQALLRLELELALVWEPVSDVSNAETERGEDERNDRRLRHRARGQGRQPPGRRSPGKVRTSAAGALAPTKALAPAEAIAHNAKGQAMAAFGRSGPPCGDRLFLSKPPTSEGARLSGPGSAGPSRAIKRSPGACRRGGCRAMQTGYAGRSGCAGLA
jgi:hypothetical protein